MKCPHCDAEMQLRQEHCPRCGKKAEISIESLTASVHEDAAIRRGERIEGSLKWMLLVMVLGCALVFSINFTWDKPLVYDGSFNQAIPLTGAVALDVPSIALPYIDPRPSPPIPPIIPTAFGQRVGDIRKRLMDSNKADRMPTGAPKVVSASIAEGLKYLRDSQDALGAWPVNIHPRDWDQMKTKEYAWGDVGVTALGLLCFLGEGESWLGADGKPELKVGKNNKTVMYNAVKFLLSKQDAATGRISDVESANVAIMYNHGMATMALCEAAGLTGDPFLREPAQKALDFIVKSQATKGGWNYKGIVDGDSYVSLSSWSVQALLAGREAGFNVPKETLDKALKMYQEAMQPTGRVLQLLGAPDDKIDRISLCGVSLTMRILLGEDPRSPELRKLVAQINTAGPIMTKPHWGKNWRPNLGQNDDMARASYDPYRMLFATHGLYYYGGKDWDDWHDSMKKAVTEMQSESGCWRPSDPWSGMGGTNYATALSIMTLQVYYRNR